ncbi:plasmid mobilization protein (plasmid) [Anaerococcus sp. DFU013_CI05]|uniref:plasmid mobilization protein n=1 Tax=Anaerococcus sp. AH8042_DFU013_CI05 TaxID=3385202 RepID=UPI003A5224C3
MDKKEKKNHRIGIRLTDNEIEKIDNEASSAGLNRSEYIRFKLGIEDKSFEDRIETFEERQEKILDLLENYDLSEEAIIKLVNELSTVKLALNNVGYDIRSLRPAHAHPGSYFNNHMLYDEYRYIRDNLDKIGEKVGLLWELQK